MRVAKDPIVADNRRVTTDTSNCPDTGATISVTGRHVMKKMGLQKNNLHKDDTHCSTADGSPLKMLGFIPVKLKVKDNNGEVHETNEILYFAEGVNATLVSLRALKNLGCVPAHWPLPACHANGLTEKDDKDEEEDEEEVMIPREPTPTRPNQPPFPCTEENIPKLKDWLVKTFSASSFNTSSAPMVKMSGPPIEIHVDPSAIPIAVHKPILIPHHWQAQVKADLDRDVKLGIIEKVPMGVPTTWQSRMVVVAKKSGKPR